jgi:hypothetical protein
MSTPSFAFPQSLADKYRPRTIADFVGLEKPKKILRKSVSVRVVVFSTKKRVQISDEIDSIRRNKNVQEFDKWRKISEMVIKDLNRKGQFFDTQQGQFFFDGDLLSAPVKNGAILAGAGRGQ